MANPRQTIALWWLRRDLRLYDNHALDAACASADIVVPVYVHAPDEGAGAAKAASRWWLHRSLQALDAALHARGSRLVVRRGASTREVLLQLVAETGAQSVHWNRLYEPAIVLRDTQVAQALQAQGVAAVSHAGHLLHEPGRVQTKSGGPYRVFTPFWRTLLPNLELSPPLPAPESMRPPVRWPASLPLAALELLPKVDWTGGLDAQWTPGEAGAHQRLQHFLDAGLSQYVRGRDLPGADQVSRLSPHLHFGELSPRQAWHAVRQAEVAEAERESWLRELGWREFAHHVLFHFPDTVTEPLHAKYRGFPWRENYAPLLDAWQRGRTGYPLVDAGMRQLWQTGWMHNRVRMVVASLLVKNLRVPWQEGAAWFMDTLVDADLASNTFNWQWAAGCGADAAPYFRIFNPVTQSEKFETANYIREYVPELKMLPDTWLYRPWQTPPGAQAGTGFVPGRDYPLPVVDYRRSREEALAALASLGAT